MKGVLQGIRVLDWSVWHVGPSAAAFLGDLGAEVIHLEELGVGDPMRAFTSMRGVPMVLEAGKHVMFEDVNRNKKGLAVDLRKKEGQEVVGRLADKCDVFCTNVREVAAKKYGLDYKTLSRRNERLVYARASLLGPEGPDAGKPGLETSGWARSGLMLGAGTEGTGPCFQPPGSGDRTGAVYFTLGILMALLARERLGIGQKVDVSQLGALFNLQAACIGSTLLTGKPVPRYNRKWAVNALTDVYQCKDGTWLSLGMPQEDRFWPGLCKAIGKEDLLHDKRFSTLETRRKHLPQLLAIFDKVFSQKTAKAWCAILGEYELWVEEIVTPDQAAADPQVLANGYVTEVDHPVLGRVKMMGPPVRLAKTPLKLYRFAPELGEHTEEILIDICGYSWEDIARLREAGAI